MNLKHGIDVASRMDYTALITLENINNNYVIRQAKRWRGQNYTQICNEITQYIKGDVIIDATGVGYAVAEMLPEPLTKIWLTGGERVTFDGQLWKVPQVQLISNLVLKIEQEQIKIPSNLSLKDNKKIFSTWQDCDWRDSKYFEGLKTQMTDRTFRQEFECEFLEMEGAALPAELIEKAVTDEFEAWD